MYTTWPTWPTRKDKMANTKKKFTIEQTYVKTDVWYDVEATSKDEAYQKIMGVDPDDERYGIDTETEINEQDE